MKCSGIFNSTLEIIKHTRLPMSHSRDILNMLYLRPPIKYTFSIELVDACQSSQCQECHRDRRLQRSLYIIFVFGVL